MVMTMTILTAAAYNTSKLYPSKHNFGQHRPIDTHCISRPYFLRQQILNIFPKVIVILRTPWILFSQSWQNIVRFLFESSLFKSLNISPAEINFPQYGTVSDSTCQIEFWPEKCRQHRSFSGKCLITQPSTVISSDTFLGIESQFKHPAPSRFLSVTTLILLDLSLRGEAEVWKKIPFKHLIPPFHAFGKN